MPGWEKRFQDYGVDLEKLLNSFAAELEKEGFKVKLNRKRMSLEATYESDVDKSWGQIVLSGEPNNFVLRIDWDADLRKLFWVKLALRSLVLVKKMSAARLTSEKISWSPSEEVTGEVAVDVPPELAELKRRVEVELDGRRSAYLAQADMLEKEGKFGEAAKFYLKAAIISQELGEKTYAIEFEKKAENLRRK